MNEINSNDFIEEHKKQKVYNKPLLKEYGNINDVTQGGKVAGLTDSQNYFSAPSS